MKYLNKLLAGALVLGMCACSSDEPAENGGNNNTPTGGIYSTLKIKSPQSRSTTKEGEEVGQDYENTVGSILVALATKEGDVYKFVTYALNDAPLKAGTENTYTVTFKEKEKLIAKAGETVYVFAYCNPSQALRDKIAGTLGADGKYTGGLAEGAEFVDEIMNGSVESIWTSSGFLMSNVEICSATLPDEATLKTYTDEAHAMSLGTIEVIRAAARFDFKDASAGSDLSYEIKNINDGTVMGKVTLVSASLFNLRQEFYYLPRNSVSGLCPGSDGMEDGFINSPTTKTFSEALQSEQIDPENEPTWIKWQDLTTLLSNDEDKDEGWGTSLTPTDKEGYHIWRYATENTFNNGETVEPTKTTGIVFKGEITVADGFGNIIGGVKVPMYLFGNVLYGSAYEVYKAVQKTPVSTLATAFAGAFDVDTSGVDPVVTPKTDDVVQAMGFTIYKPVSDHYYCYYFYYNKHNDDGNVTTYGDMEYAVVRNNVYKLSVTDIKRFGAFKADIGSVEDWDAYFTLDVKIRPWVVRINNIVL
ncbi:MAG: Mfa1 family fimbria major subunit [Muribaculaceae bacterium]